MRTFFSVIATLIGVVTIAQPTDMILYDTHWHEEGSGDELIFTSMSETAWRDGTFEGGVISAEYLDYSNMAHELNEENKWKFLRAIDIEKSDSVYIYSLNQMSTLAHMQDYLEHTLHQLKGLNFIPNATLYYAARDLPLFHYFRYPHLGAFKMQVWMRSQGKNTSKLKHVFNFEDIPIEILELGKELAGVYEQLSTVELWSTRTLSNVFEQIKYYYLAGHILRPEALRILEEVRKTIEDCENRTLKNQKKDTYKAELYLCDFLMMSNGALAKVNTNRMAWVAFSGIGLVNTSNEMFCRDYEEAFQSHIRMGVQISGSAARQRSEFFGSLKLQWDEIAKILE